VIRKDRELLVELARVNTDVVPLAMHIMEESATAAEQYEFAERLIVLGQRLHRRVDEAHQIVIDGTALVPQSVALLANDDAGTREIHKL
jgi:hypothetical protein